MTILNHAFRFLPISFNDGQFAFVFAPSSRQGLSLFISLPLFFLNSDCASRLFLFLHPVSTRNYFLLHHLNIIPFRATLIALKGE